MYGHVAPVRGIVGPDVFGYDVASTANLYDVEKAKSLISEAGYADGFEMSICVQSSDQIRQKACVTIQPMLEEAALRLLLSLWMAPLWQKPCRVCTRVQGFVLSPITAYRYENIAVYEGKIKVRKTDE